jgi:hypothetical protein
MADGWVQVHALRDKPVVTSHVMNRLTTLFIVIKRYQGRGRERGERPGILWLRFVIVKHCWRVTLSGETRNAEDWAKRSRGQGEVLQQRESRHGLENNRNVGKGSVFWDHHPGRNRLSSLDLGPWGRGGQKDRGNRPDRA